MTARAVFLTLPGLNNSGDRHWQTHWERRFPDVRRVEQRDWDTPNCKDWVETLEKAVEACGPDVVLVAHSLACTLVSRWAGRYPRRILGALLVAPSDLDAPGYPTTTTGFAPMPLKTLPFPSRVVVSQGDPYVSLDRAKQFAEAWGSELTVLQGLGHLGSDADLGMWAEGLALVSMLAETP